MNIGKRIKERLDQLNWSQNTFVEKSDGKFSRQRLSAYIRDRREPSLGTIVELAQLLNVDEAWLAFGKTKDN